MVRMKTILLMRHAKAEPGVPGQKDFDRPLAERGDEDALRMGRALAKMGEVPDAIVSSPAARAKQTAEAAARAIREIAALALPETAAAVKIFSDREEAEAWLRRPLDQIP